MDEALATYSVFAMFGSGRFVGEAASVAELHREAGSYAYGKPSKLRNGTAPGERWLVETKRFVC